MPVPEMPWYRDMEAALRPLDRYTALLLLALAGVTVYVALRGDAVVRVAWLVYLVSP